jgi:hypothetical protein
MGGVAVATSPPSSGDSHPIPFVVSGRIRIWDPVERWLWINERPLWVTPGVAVPEAAVGTAVIVSGQREQPSGIWVVTYIHPGS